MSQEEPLVGVSYRDGAAWLTLTRPERMNSLSRATLQRFGELGRELADRREVRAVVITGAGDKAFCAGADLKERQGMSEDDVRAQLGLYQTQLGWIAASRVPVIAAINGVALGGGLELALMCDLRVAAPHALFGLPETSIGIIPGAGGTQRLPRLLGEARAKELILLGRRLDAAQALAWGLVNHVSRSADSLLEDTLEFIRPIVEGAPIAQASALAAIDASFDTSLEHGLQLERLYYDACLTSADRREALAAVAEKRRPAFQGR